MYLINQNLNFNSEEVLEQFVSNLVEFVLETQKNLELSQNSEYQKSQNYTVGPLLSVGLSNEYENNLEMHVEFIYGNKISHEGATQFIDKYNYDKKINKLINPNFLVNPYTQNILHLFEIFYVKQDLKIQKKIEDLFSNYNDYIINLNKLDYKELLKDYYSIYEKNMLNEKIDSSLPANKLKMKI